MKDPDDRTGFGEAIEMLCAVKRIPFTRPLAAGYWIGMNRLSLAEVRVAVAKAIEADEAFMPSPGELVALVKPKRLPYHEPWHGFQHELEASSEGKWWSKRRALAPKEGGK